MAPLSTCVLLGVVLLAAAAPWGQETAQPLVFVGFRTLLISLTLVCLGLMRRETGPDLPTALYLMGAGTLILLLASVWASPGNDAAGSTLWYEHLLFALFFVAFVRFSALQPTRWKSTLLAALITIALLHLSLRLLANTGPLDVFSNKNYFAAYLLGPFGAAVSAFLFHQDWRWRFPAALGALALFYGILTTLSRGATLSAVAVVVLALILRGGRRLVVSVIVALGIATLSVATLSPALVTKFADRGEIDPYNYQRIQIWSTTADMIQAAPLLGTGLSRYEHVARRYRFPVDDAIGRFMKRPSIAHSEYLQYAAEAGLPVAVLIVSLLVSYIWLLWRPDRGSLHPADLFIERAGLMAAVGISLHAVVDNVFQVSVVTMTLAIVGLASSPLKAHRRIPFPASRAGQTLFGFAVLSLFAASILIPGIAYEISQVGREQSARGQLEQAVQSQRLAVAIRPNDGILLTELGLAYRDLYLREGDLRTLDIADAYLGQAAAANPDFLWPRQEQAQTLLLRLSADGGERQALHRQLAVAYLNMLRLDPFLPLVRLNLAEALYRSGKHKEAYEQATKTLSFEPNFVPGYLRLAEWYAQDGDAGESEQLRQRAASIAAKYSNRGNLTDYEASLLGRAVSHE